MDCVFIFWVKTRIFGRFRFIFTGNQWRLYIVMRLNPTMGGEGERRRGDACPKSAISVVNLHI